MARTSKAPSVPEYSIGAVLRKYRETAGYNQTELGRILGVNKNTVYNWETNKYTPDPETIRKLCAMLGMPIQELFNVFDGEHELSSDEKSFLSQYRAMTPQLRKVALAAVTAMVDAECEQRARELRNTFMVIGMQTTKAAAGTGYAFVDTPDKEYRFVRINANSRKADTLFVVSGKSMEPVYRDGDILFVRAAESGNVGDDLICSTADGVVVKRMNEERQLYSVNPAYPFPKKNEHDNVRIMGKVLGIAGKDDIADLDLVDELQEIFADEIKEFEAQ